MSNSKKIKSALISVFHKDDLDEIVKSLGNLGVKIYSTGGTQKFVESLGVPVTAVEDVTGYPSILGGRVKTLHPGVFGGILASARLTNYRLEQLEKKVDAHNHFAARMPVIEEQIHSIGQRVGRLENERGGCL